MSLMGLFQIAVVIIDLIYIYTHTYIYCIQCVFYNDLKLELLIINWKVQVFVGQLGQLWIWHSYQQR